MKKQRKSILVLTVMVVFVAAGLFMPGLTGAGDLEPISAPGPTMKTLDQIPPTWSQILPVADRFELVMGEDAVLDKETGLVWARNANIDGRKTWQGAINYCSNLSIADRRGWRLPTREELASLVDSTQANPALPGGHQFTDVQSAPTGRVLRMRVIVLAPGTCTWTMASLATTIRLTSTTCGRCVAAIDNLII